MKALIKFEGVEWVRLTSLQALKAFPKEQLLIAEMLQQTTERGTIVEVNENNYAYVTRSYKQRWINPTTLEAKKYGDIKYAITPKARGEVWMLKKSSKG